MSGDIQADYGRLSEFQKLISRKAEATRQLHQRLRAESRRLEGAWAGKGSAAFFAEMQNKVLPGVERLAAALSEASRVTARIVQVLQEAETDAAAPFRGIAGFGAGASPGAVAGAAGASLGRLAGGAANASGQGATKPVTLLGVFDDMMKRVDKASVLPGLTKDLAEGWRTTKIESVRAAMLDGAVPQRWGLLPSVTDEAAEAAAGRGAKAVKFLAENPIIEGVFKGIDVAGVGVDAWNFIADPSVEAGADLAASGLGLVGGPLGAAFSAGYTIGDVLIPDSFKETVGEKLAAWDPLKLGERPLSIRDYPRTTMNDYARKGQEMPLEVARDVYQGVYRQSGMSEALKFGMAYAQRNGISLGEVTRTPLDDMRMKLGMHPPF